MNHHIIVARFYTTVSRRSMHIKVLGIFFFLPLHVTLLYIIYCYFAKARRAFSQSILVSTVCVSVCYFAKARRAFSQSILVSTVCYFAKVNDFSQSILVSTVCLCRKVYWSVPFVCLSVLSVCHTSYRPQFCTDQDYFFTVDSAYPANFTFFFCKYRPKVKVKVTKNHENNYLSHNF